LFEQLEKLLDALADEVCIAANPDKIGVAVPARDNVDVHMFGQSRSGASAEIDTDVEALGLNRKRKDLLGVSCHFGHFKKLLVVRLVEIRDMPSRRD
jgi:hypothetical protein